MWPFKRIPLIDPESADWHLENFEWLVRCYAENESLADAKLILPKPGFFPNDGERGHALAERIFNQVKAYCQIADWPAELIPGNPVREPGRALHDVVPDDALGTQGWRTRRHGYLPEKDLVFATAIFIRAKNLDPDEPHLAKDLNRALQDLDARAVDIERIRSIEREAAEAEE